MQLTMTTDYAIRCLLCIARSDGICTSGKIREFSGISSDEHARKILRQLKYGGLVRSGKGAYGGYSLARPISEISFLDVLRCTEDSVKISRCLEDPSEPKNREDESLALYRFYESTQKKLENYLDSVKLSSFLN